VVLRPILAPAGPRGASDVAAIAIGFLVLAWTHAYSAIVVACVALAMPIVEWIFTRAIVWRRQALVALGLGPAAALVALVARWQEQDPAYRASSASALGPNDLSVFWVPVTLGAVLVFALRGAQSWVRDGHPYRLALLAWIGTVVWLHSSPLVNGYHFVPYLHLPLAILAATGLEEALLRARDATLWGKTATAGLVLALLPGSLVVTAGALAGVSRENVFPAAHAAIIEDLARRPPGNVLGPVDLGNLVPAFTPHRVWAGHWFLTPDVLARHEHYRKLMAGSGDLAGLIAAQRVRYLVVPRERAGAVAVELGAQVTERASYGGLELLVLGG
jgi:hypothetical protein